jgi:tol-pal system protein YbgF
VAPLSATNAQVSELELTTLKGRLNQLEQDVEVMRRAGTSLQRSPPSYEMIDARLITLENEIRSLTGRLEQLEFQSRTTEQELAKFRNDVDFRLGQLEGNGAGVQPPVAPLTESPGTSPSVPGPQSPNGGPRVLGQIPVEDAAQPSPRSQGNALAGDTNGAEQPVATTLPEGTPREQYAYAFDLLRTEQYTEAEVAFAAFVAAHPTDPLADNARYWLAETFYVRGDYPRSAAGFLDSYEKNKQGQKAPDSLLKLGMSLTNLGKTNEACATYAEMRRAFPNASAAIKQNEARERQRAGCR